MSPEETQLPNAPQAKKRQVEYRTPPEGLTSIYSNNIALGSTRFDVRVIFGEITDITPEKAVVENRVQVTMSWLEAKLLGDFLLANVKAFEEMNGPLTLPNIPEKVVVPETFPIAK